MKQTYYGGPFIDAVKGSNEYTLGEVRSDAPFFCCSEDFNFFKNISDNYGFYPYKILILKQTATGWILSLTEIDEIPKKRKRRGGK